MSRRVAMIGATGLVGRYLWPLVQHDGELLVLGRRASGAANEKLGEWPSWPELVAGRRLDTAISTLGTTWRKTGSWQAFAAIDRDAVLAFAKAARSAGARQFITVSSTGADAGARNRYLRLKGEIENALADIGYDRLDIVRPGLLLGERSGDRRVLERIGIVASPFLNPLLQGSWQRYRSIDAQVVAAAIAKLIGQQGSGKFVHGNRELARLALR